MNKDIEYKCKFCHKLFTKRKYLYKHINNIHVNHDKNKKQCNICFKYYADNTRLKIHQRIHSGEKPYKCNLCEKRFSDKSALRQHVKRHENGKIISKRTNPKKNVTNINTHKVCGKCEICDEIFQDGQESKRHFVQFHHGIVINI
mmetsp:Transcript_19674/g.17426  ORF Transcript_19674/g.17426 Transcript_19674/m.17426 type:complete len:145 (+) Transcript_19674:3-437(+)